MGRCVVSRVLGSSKGRDGSKELYQGVSNSTIKGAIWKLARSEDKVTVMQKPPMGSLSSLQKSLMDSPSSGSNESDVMDPVQKFPMGSPSFPRIAMDATAATLVQEALPTGYGREFMSLEPDRQGGDKERK